MTFFLANSWRNLKVIGSAVSVIFVVSSTAAISQEKPKTWQLSLSMEITEAEICEAAFAHFDNYCEYFSFVDPRLHQDSTPWSRGGIQYAWYDFDLDGKLDLFVRNLSADRCGTLGCENSIIFGSSYDSENPTANNKKVSVAWSIEAVILHYDTLGTAVSFGSNDAKFLIRELNGN